VPTPNGLGERKVAFAIAPLVMRPEQSDDPDMAAPHARLRFLAVIGFV
jgi:hypothetical protein